ncbi:hypothetical protein BWQ96_07172 [Gracilariopsis chorda]|uniref:Uncharacterized protein n=1 Tax=Gracilariopsis chorda TaxID=448386 RepID=A0A2V3ILX8_9FLOR|nr:hypothetical protein BWQ96_07172 [Gracilariopsis chorda]|eukprot:PXF43086.1 hypothetical protein BWQ96_07172 [Gracilariopsis chorda]
MTLYRNNNKFKLRGELRTPGVIRFMSAVSLLSECPKFSATIGGSSQSAHGYKPKSPKTIEKQQEQSAAASNFASVSMSAPASNRPFGTKKRKAEEVFERNLCKVAKSMDAITESIRCSATNKKMAASIALQLKILHRMSTPATEMNRRFDDLMNKAALLGGFSSPKEMVSGSSEQNQDDTSGLIGNISSYQFNTSMDNQMQE